MSEESKSSDAAEFDVPLEKRPRHVAIIMDGNGRWAQRRGLPRIEGHREGVNALRRTADECARLGVQQLTLYCLSSENWKRPPEEIDFLMQLLHQYLIEGRPKMLERDLRMCVLGRREGLPQPVIDEMDRTLAMCSDNRGLQINFAINYGGRAELVDTVREIARQVQNGTLNPDDIQEQTVSDHLYTAGLPDPDLLIRTAGEMRVSNFLLWQISYAELWVTDHLWPEFDIADLHRAFRDFAGRERRYGGLTGPR